MCGEERSWEVCLEARSSSVRRSRWDNEGEEGCPGQNVGVCGKKA